jgi:hypothetical protein
MFCPVCGAESTQGLNYCKRCGTSLYETTQSPPAPPTKNVFAALILAVATTAIVLGGFGILFTMTVGLIGPQPPGLGPPAHDATAVAGMMVAFGSATIGLVTLMVIKLFTRLMGFGATNEKSEQRLRRFANAPGATQLPPPPISMESVTEHTTRNFEPRIHRRETRD